MRAIAIWGLSVGLLTAASSVHAAPPEGPAEPATPPPHYDEASIVLEPAPPIEPEPAPHTGVGRIVSGSLMLAGGAGGVFSLTGLLIWRSKQGGNDCDPTVDTGGDCRAGALDGLIVLYEVSWFLAGAGLIASGGALLGTGIADHRRYRKWERGQDDRPVPPRGDGMLGSGLALMGMGVTASALTIGLTHNNLQYPGPAAAFTTSVVMVVGGTGLVIGSAVLRRKHMRWQKARMTPSLSLLPGARDRIGGLSFGVAGRF